MRFTNFSKSYGDNKIYENFNLEVSDSEITCILGESGSGKTTLLNAVAGLIPYGGEITKVKCSYVFQKPRLVPNLKVKENLKLVCKDEEKINRMLAAAGLSDKAEEYPKNLSGGQAQRVSVIRAFLYEADAYLLDEPFSSLDLKLKIKLAGEFRAAWEKNKKCVLFVTHDADEALYFADRIVVLKSGEAVSDFTLSGGKREYGARSEERERIIKALLN